MKLSTGFVVGVVHFVSFLFDIKMKTFIIGFAVATVGLSGVANIIDVGINILQTHAQQLNTQLSQIDQQ